MYKKIKSSLLYQGLFIISLGIAIITGSLIWNINDTGYQSKSFATHNISIQTGLNESELHDIAKSIRAYFNSSQEFLDVSFPSYPEYKVFNEKEVAHMKDVKHIIRYVYGFFLFSLIYVFIFIISYAISNNEYKRRLLDLISLSAFCTLLLITLFSLGMLFAFNKMFLLFHLISFNNDYWILDPYTDYLLILYPYPFWFNVCIRVAIMIVVPLLILIPVPWLLKRKIKIAWPISH